MERTIILPKNQGLKDAYINILKMVYFEQRETYLFHEYVQAVGDDCGVSKETATIRCKQLSSLGLLKYVNSGLAGHNYMTCVYVKEGGEVNYIDNLPEAGRLIEAQFPEMVESEFLQIKRNERLGMKLSEARARIEGDMVFKSFENSIPIRTESDETLKSKVLFTDKLSQEDVCRDFERRLKTNGSVLGEV